MVMEDYLQLNLQAVLVVQVVEDTILVVQVIKVAEQQGQEIHLLLVHLKAHQELQLLLHNGQVLVEEQQQLVL